MLGEGYEWSTKSMVDAHDPMQVFSLGLGLGLWIFTTTTLSEQNYTLSRTTLSGAELHIEQNYTLSRTRPKIEISKISSAKTPQ